MICAHEDAKDNIGKERLIKLIKKSDSNFDENEACVYCKFFAVVAVGVANKKLRYYTKSFLIFAVLFSMGVGYLMGRFLV